MNFFARLFTKKKKYLAGNFTSPIKYTNRYPDIISGDDSAPGEGYTQPYTAGDYTPLDESTDQSTHFDGGSFGGGGASDSWSDDSGSSGSYDSGSSDSGSSDSGSSGSD